MPYDKNGKYYRQPTNSVNKDKKSSNTTSNKTTPKSVTTNKKRTSKVKSSFGTLEAIVTVFLLAIIGGCVAVFNNLGNSSKPKEFDSIYARVWCKDQIKSQLKDPSSYKFYSAKVLRTSGEYKEYGAATIEFGAKNSFGGMIRQTAICDKFNKNGTDYIRVNILP